MDRYLPSIVLVAAAFLGVPPAALAAESNTLIAATHRPSSESRAAAALEPALRAAAGELVLSAPPRDSVEDGERRFGPIAEHLSKILGRRVVYRHPGTWGGYQADMQRGVYDIVFDGPHFNGWRVKKLGHNVLAKLPGEFTYVAAVRKDNTRIQNMSQLAGRTFCAHAPPNLGTLIMLNEFDNPSRQPSIIVTDGYNKIYDALLAGKCTAAMLPLKHLAKRDPDGAHTRVVFKNPSMPQQAFSAGPRLSPAEQAKVTEALLSPTNEPAFAKFREAYSLGRSLVRAGNEEYTTLGKYLKDTRGF
jgi:ABC-type phosphate/phosphonate transport system substrate-binding protein